MSITIDRSVHIPIAVLTPIDCVDDNDGLIPQEDAAIESTTETVDESGKKVDSESEGDSDGNKHPRHHLNTHANKDNDNAVLSSSTHTKTYIPTEKSTINDPDDPAAGFQITNEWINVAGVVDDEKGLVERLYVDWLYDDKRNPSNFSYTRKWIMTGIACWLTLLSAYVGSAFSSGYPSMTLDLSCSQFQATIGLSVYALGFGVIPLFSAALSEEFGRHPLYLVSTLIFMVMQLGIALAKNIQSVQIFRFIAGAAGSTGSTMVGGTVADIWSPSERGVPMAVFSLMAIGGTGLGPVASGWIELNPKLGWRWIAWIQFILIAAILLSIPLGMKESRSGVLLTRHAKALRKKTGDERYRARVEDTRPTLKDLIVVSCTRPIHFLTTEPIIISFSLWIGFAWGIVYSLVESVAPAFRELHNFNDGEVGTAFVGMVIGAFLGFATNFYQERLYHRYVKVRGEEARLYAACVAGIGFPIGMFIYAWTSFTNVAWIGMVIGLVIFIWSCFIMYLAVFTYLADCYGIYASSALAGQSLARNILATVFPLFTTQMYDRLTFKWSSTLFGCIAVLMAPIPFVLFHWGPKIRAKSKFAQVVPAFGQ